MKQRLLPFLASALHLEPAALAHDTALDILLVDVQERIKTLSKEAAAMLDFALLDELPDYDSRLLIAKKLDAAASYRALTAARAVLVNLGDLQDPEQVESTLRTGRSLAAQRRTVIRHPAHGHQWQSRDAAALHQHQRPWARPRCWRACGAS